MPDSPLRDVGSGSKVCSECRNVFTSPLSDSNGQEPLFWAFLGIAIASLARSFLRNLVDASSFSKVSKKIFEVLTYSDFSLFQKRIKFTI